MPGIATIQHPLGDIDPRPRYVGFAVHIGNSIDRAAVNSHPQVDARMRLQGSAYFLSASHRLLRTAEKKERHPGSHRQADEFAGCCRRSETFGASDDLIELLQQF